MLEGNLQMPDSFAFLTTVFGASKVFKVFKPPRDDVVTKGSIDFETDLRFPANDCICHRRRVRNVQTNDTLEVCLIRPNKTHGVRAVYLRLFRS